MYIEHQGKNYSYETETKKLYLIEDSAWNTLGIVMLLLTVLFFAYDFIKDGMRTLSNFRDFFTGKEVSFRKFIGFTRSNMYRQIIKMILFIVSFILLSIENKKEISPIPEEIKAKLT